MARDVECLLNICKTLGSTQHKKKAGKMNKKSNHNQSQLNLAADPQHLYTSENTRWGCFTCGFFFNNFETLTTFLPLPISLFNPCFWVSSMAAYIEAWSVRCCVFSLILAGFLREGKFHLTLGIQNWHQLLKNIISDMASSHTTGSTHFWFWFLLLFLRGSYVSQTGQNLLYSWG